MPWHVKAKKDVVSCEKPRGGANDRRSGDVRMGQPLLGNARRPAAEHIGSQGQTRRTETSKYRQEEKSKEIL